MKARITFRSEIYITGDNLKEIHDKWLAMNLYSEEASNCSCEYVDTESIEDAETYEDIESEWNAIENGCEGLSLRLTKLNATYLHNPE